MPTLVNCDCGKRLRVEDRHIGCKVKCPACGAAVTVPTVELNNSFNVVPDGRPKTSTSVECVVDRSKSTKSGITDEDVLALLGPAAQSTVDNSSANREAVPQTDDGPTPPASADDRGGTAGQSPSPAPSNIDDDEYRLAPEEVAEGRFVTGDIYRMQAKLGDTPNRFKKIKEKVSPTRKELPEAARNVVRDYAIHQGQQGGIAGEIDERAAQAFAQGVGNATKSLLSFGLFGGGILGTAAGLTHHEEASNNFRVSSELSNETAEQKEMRWRKEAGERLTTRGYPLNAPKYLVTVMHALRNGDFAALSVFLRHSDDKMRVAALSAIRDLGSDFGDVVAEIAPMLADPLEDLRYRAVNVLCNLGLPAAYAIPHILTSLLSPSSVRLDVGRIMSDLATVEPLTLRVVPFLIKALTDTDPGIREAAASQLAHLGAHAKPALAALGSLTSDEHDNVRRAAVAAVDALQQPQNHVFVKVPCKTCGNLILPATARRHDGLCKRCAGEGCAKTAAVIVATLASTTIVAGYFALPFFNH